ncbi:hypothetical protein LTR96_011553 [Exophiala xenobiotica]|nr:hypothetical protein LTR96_011553 [Exophiala xenobiotica]KAK5332318.1 hypothetical protein LTR98_011548 [Exophiala xenobiotica]
MLGTNCSAGTSWISRRRLITSLKPHTRKGCEIHFRSGLVLNVSNILKPGETILVNTARPFAGEGQEMRTLVLSCHSTVQAPILVDKKHITDTLERNLDENGHPRSPDDSGFCCSISFLGLPLLEDIRPYLDDPYGIITLDNYSPPRWGFTWRRKDTTWTFEFIRHDRGKEAGTKDTVNFIGWKWRSVKYRAMPRAGSASDP